MCRGATIHFFGITSMTTHFAVGTNLIRLLTGLAGLLLIASAAIAQPTTGTVKRLTIKSAVLGEERTVLVRTPVGYETNKLSYPVLYMTDGDAHMGHTASSVAFLTQNGRVWDLSVVGGTNSDRSCDLRAAESTDKNPAG